MNAQGNDISATRLLPGARELVLEAGGIILRSWNRPKDVRRKGRIDLVTSTDTEVERFLKDGLHKILPAAAFLAEETDPGSKAEDTAWIIDPLDGTTNFAHNLPAVAVSVALWHGGGPLLGMVYAPVTGELFHAVRGEGAFLNDSPIRVSGRSELVQSLVATGFPYDIRDRLDEVMPRLRRVLAECRGVRRLGAAAVDLAYTACGRFDAFYEMGLKPWDTAAGWLLVTEAGGRVTRFDPGSPYCLHAGSILATNGRIHEDLAALLA
jgi:myo-inositol-1(or 4)-monophosphatase